MRMNELINQQTQGGHAIIPFTELINTTKASFAAIDSLKTGRWVEIK